LIFNAHLNPLFKLKNNLIWAITQWHAPRLGLQLWIGIKRSKNGKLCLYLNHPLLIFQLSRTVLTPKDKRNNANPCTSPYRASERDPEHSDGQ
jgi:hypothetical protein